MAEHQLWFIRHPIRSLHIKLLSTTAFAGALLIASLPIVAMAEQRTLTFEIEGSKRSALVFAPNETENALVPLVIVFHGRGGDSSRFARAVRLHKDWPDAVVVYPRGLRVDSQPPMRGWQHRSGQYSDRDLALTDALLERLSNDYPIDPARRYAAGFSNGGHFTLLLMQERASEFASFAVIAALQPQFSSDAEPKPLLYLFGRDEGTQLQDPWEKTVRSLAKHQGANGDQAPYDSCCTLLAPAPGGAEMVYGLYNAGHIWPHQGNEWLRRFFTRFGGVEDVSTQAESNDGD